jgi:hypothetical protein
MGDNARRAQRERLVRARNLTNPQNCIYIGDRSKFTVKVSKHGSHGYYTESTPLVHTGHTRRFDSASQILRHPLRFLMGLHRDVQELRGLVGVDGPRAGGNSGESQAHSAPEAAGHWNSQHSNYPSSGCRFLAIYSRRGCATTSQL